MAKYFVEESKLDPSARANEGVTPLMNACIVRCCVRLADPQSVPQNGHLPLVQWLVEAAGANRLDRDDKGCTPLLYAAHDGRSPN